VVPSEKIQKGHFHGFQNWSRDLQNTKQQSCSNSTVTSDFHAI